MRADVEPPRYRKIHGHWYVLKSHAAEQMQRVLISAQLDVIAEIRAKCDPAVPRKALEIAAQ